MTEPMPQQSDDTRNDAPQPSGLEEPGVRGGDAADRMDSAGPGSGGLPGAGADGETDDPQGGSIQAHGSRPA